MSRWIDLGSRCRRGAASASKAYGFDANTDDIVALLESGTSVVTVTPYAHLPTLGTDVDERIRKARDAGGSRFCPAGEHPGFMLEKLAVSLTAMCQRVDTITVQQFVDCSQVPEERMLVDLMGMGKRPEEISIESPAFRSVSTQSEQAINAAADALGVRIDHFDHVIKTATSPNDVTVDCTTLPAGTVVGQSLSWTGYHDGKPVLVVEEFWTCTPDIPDWNLALDGHTVRIRVDGVPNIAAEVRVDTGPVEHFGNNSGGFVAVGISAIRAVPYALKEPTGNRDTRGVRCVPLVRRCGTDVKARSDSVSTVHSPWLPVASAAGAVLLGLIVYNARHGAVSPRIRNPHDTGAPHPLSDPLFGYGHWIVTIEIFSYLAPVSIVALIVALWRRHPRHPYLLMTIAVSTLAWLDAPMNWATFAAYNPDLWHWPEGWPIVSLYPTIEPLFIAAIAMFVVPTFFPGDLASAAAASAPPESTQPNGRPSVATPPVGRRCAPVVQKGCSRSC